MHYALCSNHGQFYPQDFGLDKNLSEKLLEFENLEPGLRGSLEKVSAYSLIDFTIRPLLSKIASIHETMWLFAYSTLCLFDSFKPSVLQQNLHF